MSLTKIDATEKALDRLTFDLSKPNFEKFVQVYTDEVQLVEDAIYDMAGLKSIDNAFGIWLDYLGKILGISRNGLSDEDYRSLLRLQIGINTSDGTPNVMIDLITQYTLAQSTRINEGTIAWGTIYTNGTSNISGSLYALVQDIKPVGTRWIIHSDYFDNAFQPGWEVTTGNQIAFQTTDDGIIIDTFQTTQDLLNYENFFTASGGVTYYAPSLGRDIPAWESTAIDPFSVETGIEIDTFSVDTGTEVDDFNVATTSEGGTYIPLCWEIFPYSKPISNETPTQFGPAQFGGVDDQFGYISGT